MKAILSLDFDFFLDPVYFGDNYAIPEFNSYTDFQAKAKEWLTPKQFIQKLNLKPTKGISLAEGKQQLLYWRNFFSIAREKPETIVHFDSHPNCYINKDYSKIEITNFNNFDYLIVPFREHWVKYIYWVVPDYFNNDLIKEHFQNINAIIQPNRINIRVGDVGVELRIVKWSEYNLDIDFNYLSVVLNKKICGFYSTKFIEDFKGFFIR